ncbi:MAG: hypothetical protein RR369_00200 [Lachnospiraceae bacterium]
MLNEERVKLMTELAFYESKEGKEDFPISAYYRKDYASLRTLQTILWVTLGYVLAAALAAVAYMDVIMKHFNMTFVLILGGGVVLGYVLLVIIYAIIAHDFYQKKHNEARKNVKKYNRELLRLNKMYEKEKL